MMSNIYGQNVSDKARNDKMDMFVTLASGLQRSAIGVILLIGSDADELLSRFFSAALPTEPGQIKLGDFVDEHDNVIDQVLIVNVPIDIDKIRKVYCSANFVNVNVRPDRRINVSDDIDVFDRSNISGKADISDKASISYSDKANIFDKDNISDKAKVCDKVKIYEITTHGGIRIIQRVIETMERAGAKFVDNDTLISSDIIPVIYQLDNIVAAEAYKILPRVKSTAAVKFLLYQAHNGLARLISCRDEDVLKQIFRYWPAVNALLNGIRVVIAGPPNAGKSTLINTLTRVEHSLVADFPGTTRDYVSANAILSDLPVELIDTAGLGQTDDILSRQSSEQTIKQIQQADVIFAILDSTNLTESKRFLEQLNVIIPNSDNIVYLINKIDRKDIAIDTLDFLPPNRRVLKISALNNINSDKIADMLVKIVGLEGFDYRFPTVFTEYLALYFSR